MSSDSSDIDDPLWPRPPRLPIGSLYPGRGQSLTGISSRAFILGTVLGLSVSVSTQLLLYNSSYWRPLAIIAALALFHFLEFYSTAISNPPRARVSAFILTSNGRAYFAAHGISFTEFFLRRWFTSEYWPFFLTYTGYLLEFRKQIQTVYPYAAIVGIALMVMGQSVRTAAMVEAGKSFNHLVQYKKRDDHHLVTTGVYSWFRHPAYFGFFWYVIGTQLVMANPICLVLLSYATWRFFSHRIPREYLEWCLYFLCADWYLEEEKFLVGFFGQAYIDYSDRTKIFIPFLT